MNLIRLRKWLLPSALLVFLAAFGLVYLAVYLPYAEYEMSLVPISASLENSVPEPKNDLVEIDFSALRLQRRLFDPPPEPVVEEVKAPPSPPPIKIMATMIEPNSKQAIIVGPDGSTSFVSLNGTFSVSDGQITIKAITQNSVLVTFKETEFDLPIESQ